MIKKKPAKKIPPKRSYENEFYQELTRVLRAFEMLEYWKRLPQKLQAKFAANIIRPMRFERDAASGVEAGVVSALKNDIKKIIDDCYLDLKPYNSKCALHDFLTAGVSLLGSIEMFIDATNDDFGKWVDFHVILTSMLNKEHRNPIRMMSVHLDNMCLICTSIDRAYYWIDRTNHAPTHSEAYTCLVYTLKKNPAEKTHATIDGKSRPVYRLGIPERDGVQWASVSVDISATGGEKEDGKVPVYIQVHALERLWERLAPLEKPKIQALLYAAFENPEFSRGPEGSHFVAFRYNDVKIGYLPYETDGAMAVVTTFLLLTQNGTHEGNALNKEYGLSKYAKTYFELDRLHTFINTDVYQDEELKALFAKCGCDGLFHVWDKTDDTISFGKNYAKNLKKIFFKSNYYRRRR
ncbi:MAG: hypothetical protein JW913_08110 [Chitinispirillaceae bacterium]|nr:hypothetical protein [Chitinispirillaceae bacterium]